MPAWWENLPSPPPSRHRACTVILKDVRPNGDKIIWPKTAPKQILERTHGCWCSSWKWTRRGWRVWRENAWRRPVRGDVCRKKRDPLEPDRVACTACGRLIVASKNGHPRHHSPKTRLGGGDWQRNLGTCDGTFLPGNPP